MGGIVAAAILAASGPGAAGGRQDAAGYGRQDACRYAAGAFSGQVFIVSLSVWVLSLP